MVRMPCGLAASLFFIFVSMAMAIPVVSSTRKGSMEPVAESNPLPVLIEPSRMWDSPSADSLAMNASVALRNAGYHIMGAAFEMFADQFLPLGPKTFFAINDLAMVNNTLPSWLAFTLLRYHTATEMLLWQDLRILNSDYCLPTRLYRKGLVVTTERTETTVALNGVVISHPDIFVAGGLAIHGVQRTFFYVDESITEVQYKSLPLPSCDVYDRLPIPKEMYLQRRRNAASSWLWRSLQLALNVNGCWSFSAAMEFHIEQLKAGLAEAKGNSNCTRRMTVFAPVDGYAGLSSASAVVGDKLMFHVVPQRLTMADLRRLPPKHKIPTLFRGHNLEIAFTGDSRRLVINGVLVVRPDAFKTNEFILHGISQAFDLLNVTNT